MTKEERMKEIAKASPNFGKRVGYKMCVVDELHDMKELEAQNKWLEGCKSELAEHLGKANDRIAELEKENAELKEKLKPENCLKLLAKEGYIKFTSDQLTKAKEIIEELYNIIPASMADYAKEPMEHARKFLTEEVDE